MYFRTALSILCLTLFYIFPYLSVSLSSTTMQDCVIPDTEKQVLDVKMIIHVGDFGFSEAVNYGILKAFRGGLVGNIGPMSSMPYAKQAFDMIREENVMLGPHVDLTLRSPYARPEQVPSLLNMDGKFLFSRVRRREMEEGIDSFVYEDTVVEVKAQVEQFLSICGRLPDYIDAHAVYTGTAEKAIRDIADAYGIDTKKHIEDTHWRGIQTDYTNTEFYKQKLPFAEFFKSYLNYSDRISLVVFHPSYLDYGVIHTSSLTVNRCLDTALLCDAEVKEYLKQHTSLSFKEL